MNEKWRPQQYKLRGHRVSPLSYSQIESRVAACCRKFNLDSHTPAGLYDLIDLLAESQISVDIIEDKAWFDLTSGHCDPSTLTIRLPNKTIVAATKGNARALETFFHELGHLLLAHKVVLHDEGSSPAGPMEDSEEQADLFARLILEKIGVYRQLTLPI